MSTTAGQCALSRIGVVETDGEDLIGTARGIVALVPIDDIVEITASGVPKAPVEREPGFVGMLGEGASRLRALFLAEPTFQEPQRVVPERVDLHRFAAPRRHHPVADLGVHPGKLIPVLSLAQQAVRRVHTNAEAGAAQMVIHDTSCSLGSNNWSVSRSPVARR